MNKTIPFTKSISLGSEIQHDHTFNNIYLKIQNLIIVKKSIIIQLY